jgi:hypothetical protein
MSAKEMKDRMLAAIEEDGTAFELRRAYGYYELWANDDRIEAGNMKDVYNAWIKYRFKEKYSKKTNELQESAIRKIHKVLSEAPYGYSERNPKIELHYKDSKGEWHYLGTTQWARTVKQAVEKMIEKLQKEPNYHLPYNKKIGEKIDFSRIKGFKQKS